MEISSNILASQLTKVAGGSSAFATHLVEQGPKTFSSAADLKSEIARVDTSAFSDAERTWLDELVSKLAGKQAEHPAATAILTAATASRAAAAIPAREVDAPSPRRRPNEPFSFGKDLKDPVLETTRQKVSDAVQRAVTVDAQNRPRAVPAPAAEIVSAIQKAIGNGVALEPGSEAAGTFGQSVTAGFERLITEESPFTPLHLQSVEQAGFTLPEHVHARALSFVRQDVEDGVWDAFMNGSAPRPTPPGETAPYANITNLLRARVPSPMMSEAGATFSDAVTRGFQRLVDAQAPVRPHHLAAFLDEGYTLPTPLKRAVMAASQRAVEQAVRDAFTKDTRGRAISQNPTGATLVNQLKQAITANLPPYGEGREVELFAESVEKAFRGLVAEGRELTFEQLTAVETLFQTLQAEAAEAAAADPDAAQSVPAFDWL